MFLGKDKGGLKLRCIKPELLGFVIFTCIGLLNFLIGARSFAGLIFSTSSFFSSASIIIYSFSIFSSSGGFYGHTKTNVLDSSTTKTIALSKKTASG